MKELVVKYLRLLFPFIITIALWRISVPWINPAGILAIIPIFYCIDLTHTNKSGVYAFMGFVGAVIFLMTATNLSLMNLLSGAIMFAVLTIMYIPVITTVQVVQND